VNGFSLYCRYLGASIRGQMQYRASFILMTLGGFLVTFSEFIGIWVLFSRFKSLAGWNLAEIAFFYGLVSVAFALSESAARGFDLFSGLIKTGGFDRVLLRPRRLALQIAAQELQLMRIGRLSQALVILIWASISLDVDWNAARLGLTVMAAAGGACLFYGLFVLQATLCFFSTETLEVMNVLTYGGVETAQFPISIYRDSFRRFFTFVVPLACVTYFPILEILGREDTFLHSPAWFRWTAPLAGFLFLFVCFQIFGWGVRQYRSTGS